MGVAGASAAMMPGDSTTLAPLLKSIQASAQCHSEVQRDIAACEASKLAVYEKLLNSNYQRLLAVFKKDLGAQAAKGLINVQRQWVTLRQSDCHQYVQFSQGEMGPVNETICQADWAKARADQLDALYAFYTQH